MFEGKTCQTTYPTSPHCAVQDHFAPRAVQRKALCELSGLFWFLSGVSWSLGVFWYSVLSRKRLCRKTTAYLCLYFHSQPADWEKWSRNFNAYIWTFETVLVTLLDRVELMNDEFADETSLVVLDTGDPEEEATAFRLLFFRKLHYHLSQLVTDSGKLIVQQNEDPKGFETWRKLCKNSLCQRNHQEHAAFDTAFTFQFQPCNPLSRTVVLGKRKRLGVNDSRAHFGR